MRARTVVLCQVALAVGGCHSPPPVAAAPPPWLEARIQEAASQSVPGTAPEGPLLRGVAYDEGERAEWKLGLDAGHCYSFVGAGDNSVERLSLYLWNPSNKRVADDRSRGPTAVVSHCVQETGLYRLEAKVAEGAGHFGIRTFVRAGPPAPPTLDEAVEAEAAAIAPGAARVGNLLTGSGESTSWYTPMETGNCYWIVGAAGKGVSELYLYLWDQQNRRITENKPPSPRANVGHCPVQSGMFHFEAKIRGSGDYRVGVYQRPR